MPKGVPSHVTLRVVGALPSLRSPELFVVIRRCLLAQRATEDAVFQVVHFSVQVDHIHLIVEAADAKVLAGRITGLKVRIARAVNRATARRGHVWAGRYHRHDLRTPTEARNAIRYVLMNTHKHYRVFSIGPFADPKSSAATFDGFTEPVAIAADSLSWPTVSPRTWLLGPGWRRHGLLPPWPARTSS